MGAEKKAATKSGPAKTDVKSGDETAKRRHTGKMKRSMQRRIGRPVEMQSLDCATPAKSAAALEANARSALAGGRTERASPEANVAAFAAVHVDCHENAAGLEERGLSKVAVAGAKLVCEKLGVLLEVAALSVAAVASAARLDDVAFVGKRRDAVVRVAPGPQNTAFRAKFGLDEPVRMNQPATILRAARRLLAARKAMPSSRAAKLITAADEKRLRGIVQTIDATEAARTQARRSGSAQITERDILNCALEMFYDDYAASIGLVLEGDEVARIQALELVPRRTERREESEEKGASGDGSTEAGSGASTPASPVPATA